MFYLNVNQKLGAFLDFYENILFCVLSLNLNLLTAQNKIDLYHLSNITKIILVGDAVGLAVQAP